MNALEGRASPTLNPSLTLEFCALSLHSNSLVQIKPPQSRTSSFSATSTNPTTTRIDKNEAFSAGLNSRRR